MDLRTRRGATESAGHRSRRSTSGRQVTGYCSLRCATTNSHALTSKRGFRFETGIGQNRTTAFTASVGNIAKLRQQLVEDSNDTKDPALRLTLESVFTTRILYEFTAARALPRDVANRDIDVPQLIVLINEATNENDLNNVGELTARAVNIKSASASRHAEALRYRAQHLYQTGQPEEGRKLFEQAIELIQYAEGGNARHH